MSNNNRKNNKVVRNYKEWIYQSISLLIYPIIYLNKIAKKNLQKQVNQINNKFKMNINNKNNLLKIVNYSILISIKLKMGK